MPDTLMSLPDLPAWAVLGLIGLVALAESLAFIGLLLPGVALLFALAFAAGSGSLDLAVCLLVAFVGAVLGDGLSFWLGRHNAPRIRALNWVQRHPGWLQQGETFFHRWGAPSMLLGRFVGPLRPIIPFVAGSCRMPPTRFLLLNLISALGWAPLYLLPGYLAGRGLNHLPDHLLPLLWVAALFCFVLLCWQQLHYHLQTDGYLARRLLRFMPADLPPGPVLLLTGAALVLLASSVLTLVPLGQHINTRLLPILQSLGDLQPQLVLGITLAGDLQLALLLALLTGLYGAAVLRQPQAWGVVLGTLAVVGLNVLLKHLFAIERPDQAPLHTFSFPSGHASAAAAWLGLSVVWWGHRRTHAVRHRAYLLVAPMILLIGLSRTLLGVHWPLDVVAGIAEGLVVAALYRLWLYQKPAARPASRWWPLAVLLVLAGYMLWRFEAAASTYLAVTG